MLSPAMIATTITMAWALLEEPIESWSEDGPIAKRADAYRLLTGMEVPRLVGNTNE